MALNQNPVLGYRECSDCGQRGAVLNLRGSRAQLYQRCGCGCVQANGAFIQSRLWYETKWLEDAPAMPAMVLDRAEYEKELARVAALNFAACPSRSIDGGQEDSGLEADFKPETVEVEGGAGVSIGEGKKKGGGLLVLAALGVLMAGLGA